MSFGERSNEMKVMVLDGSNLPSRHCGRLASRYAMCLLLFFSTRWLLPGAAYQVKTKAPATRPPTRPNSQQTPAKPSLDALLQRAKDYWSLLAQSNKRRAMEYVETSCRDYFLVRTFPSFSSPRVTKLEPGESGKEVAVTVTVKRRLGTLPGEFDYPVMNRWVFSRGNWWVVVKDAPTAEALGMHSADGRSVSPEEVEKGKAFIRSHLKFASDTIDFGTVRKGQFARFAVDYQWTGDQPAEAAIHHGGAVELYGVPERKLLPGGHQQISLEMPTADFDGRFLETFSILVTHQGIGVSYEFKLQGSVYTPVSVIPSALRFRAGESEKAVELVNNSTSEVRLDSFTSDTDGYEVSPLPQSLAPGARCVLKVKMLLKLPDKNQAEEIYIVLAAPVDDVYRLRLPVMANAEEPQKQKALKDLNLKDIEELLRKSGQSPIKP
jgi:hypothetical protein